MTVAKLEIKDKGPPLEPLEEGLPRGQGAFRRSKPSLNAGSGAVRIDWRTLCSALSFYTTPWVIGYWNDRLFKVPFYKIYLWSVLRPAICYTFALLILILFLKVIIHYLRPWHPNLRLMKNIEYIMLWYLLRNYLLWGQLTQVFLVTLEPLRSPPHRLEAIKLSVFISLTASLSQPNLPLQKMQISLDVDHLFYTMMTSPSQERTCPGLGSVSPELWGTS